MTQEHLSASTETTTARREKQLRLRLPSSSRMSEAKFAYLFLVPLVIALFVLLAFPFFYSLWVSLHRVLLGRGAWQFLGLQQYARAFSDPIFWHSLRLTLLYTVITTALSFVIALGGALILNETFRGKRVVMVLVILPWAFSAYAAAVIWRYIYLREIGLINALIGAVGLEPMTILTPAFAIPAVAIAHAWQMAPFGVYFLLATLQVIPPELYRVARVDRLGVVQRFRHVTLPYLKYPMLAIAILIVLAAARTLDVIYFITNGGPGNASFAMTFLVYNTTFKAYDFGYGAALSQLLMAIIFVPMVAYFILLLRQRKQSLV